MSPRTRMDIHEPLRLYSEMRPKYGVDVLGAVNSAALTKCVASSVRAVSKLDRLRLVSKVPDKEYFAFKYGQRISRAINAELFLPPSEAMSGWEELLTSFDSDNYSTLDPVAVTRAIYTAAISFCACIDVVKDGDQKTPGTFFEYLIGHTYARRLGMNPTKKIDVLNLDMKSSLPTDFVFNLGIDKPKFHLPIKTSTRERIIQVWAHQRVLDGVYGTGRFLGTPVVLTETKTGKRKREVVEICLPDQWRIYQMHIAQLKRIYYLDLPVAYAKLNDLFPPIHVRPFGEFFIEFEDLCCS